MIRQDAAEAEDGIPALEDLSRVENGRTEATYVIDQMRQNVEFVLGEYPVWVDDCPYVKDICHEYLQVVLPRAIKTAYYATRRETYQVLVHVSDLMKP